MMKSNPADKAIRDRMAPGVLSRDGFLGRDRRNLDAIIDADADDLEAAGTSAAEVADALDDLHEAADEALETPRPAGDGTVTVQLTEVRGRIPCPFGCGFKAHKAAIRVAMPEATFTFTPLSSHLIRAHGFFQGKGAPFRIEPRDAAALVRHCRRRDG